MKDLLALTIEGPGGGAVFSRTGSSSLFGGRITTFGDLISVLLFVAILIGGFVSTLYFILGAFRFITSGGDPKAVQGAKGQILGAIIGFLIVLIAYVVLVFFDRLLGTKVTILGSLLVPNAYAVVDIGREIPFGGSSVRETFPDLSSFGGVFGSWVVRLLFGAGFITAFIVIILSGIKFMTSGGDEKAVASAKSMITMAIVGILLLFGAIVFLTVISRLFDISFV